MTEFKPSPCPILDLGVTLEANDPNDPWRRMPRLFQIAKGTLGSGMYRHGSRARTALEGRMGHYCATTRQTHGACTMRRARLCEDALAHVLQLAAFADKDQEWAAVQAGITRLLRDERHHEALKATRVTKGQQGCHTDELRMPPIALRGMPDEP